MHLVFNRHKNLNVYDYNCWTGIHTFFVAFHLQVNTYSHDDTKIAKSGHCPLYSLAVVSRLHSIRPGTIFIGLNISRIFSRIRSGRVQSCHCLPAFSCNLQTISDYQPSYFRLMPITATGQSHTKRSDLIQTECSDCSFVAMNFGQIGSCRCTDAFSVGKCDLCEIESWHIITRCQCIITYYKQLQQINVMRPKWGVTGQ